MSSNTRVESDSLGDIDVDKSRYWGSQTQRALENFRIGHHRFPPVVYRAFGIVKKAAALANRELGKLPEEKCDLIVKACDEVMQGGLDEHFPLKVWQTGSGTQTNMNVNEVIANRAIELAGGQPGTRDPVHPNDHVNMSQSSNDVFPTVMHLAGMLAFNERLFPAIKKLADMLEARSREYKAIVKIGRTHLMDAVPLTLGQEFSAFAGQIRFSEQQLKSSQDLLRALAIGGTAVGTGLNSHPRYTEKVIARVNEITGLKFIPATNKFMGIAAHDAVVNASSALRLLATANMKIANDIRLYGSGPRSGLGELLLPANEPGSSIMPGKVNPTQCEAMTMVCAHVIGLDTTAAIAGMGGQFQLNTFKPVLLYNLLDAVYLLSDAMESFTEHCLRGLRPDTVRITEHVNNSLMLVTALNQHIGYDNAAKIAKNAFSKNITLKESAHELGLVDESEFDKLVDPIRMTRNQ